MKINLKNKKFHYTPPENGYPEWNNNPELFQLNRMDAHARWARIKNKDGIGLYISSDSVFELGAIPYTPFELESYDHQYKLPISDKTVLRINYKQMGVGGDDSWGAKTHAKYTLYANKIYEFTYRIKGFTN